MNATNHKTLLLNIDAKYMFCAQSTTMQEYQMLSC